MHRILARLEKLERKDIGENVEELPLELGPTSIGYYFRLGGWNRERCSCRKRKKEKKKIIRAVVGKGLERRK